uniref:UGT76AH1 n=1 Tax=Miconia microphysca TaxID=3021300 RepID=A0AA50KIK9_9MYRT|nr:UGT76AH1 [Miconia microphysca]
MGTTSSQDFSTLNQPNIINYHKVILFPLPFQGHMNSMLQLAQILHSQGFSVTVLHIRYNPPRPSDHPGFDFHPVDVPSPVAELEAVEGDTMALISLLNVTCVVPFRESLENLMGESSDGGDHVACLITDICWHFTQAIADEVGIPRMVLRTTSIGSISAFSAVSRLQKNGLLPLPESQIEEVIPEVAPLRWKDLPIVPTRNPKDFFRLLADIDRATKACAGLISNSFEELEEVKLAESRRSIPIPFFLIGPFHKRFPSSSTPVAGKLLQDQSCIAWLDKQSPKSTIYVSFGSIASIDERDFLEIVRGLANSGVPFLWVVRPGSVRGHEWLVTLPPGLLEGKGHIVKWAPQREVLAHPSVGAFWTHNGWNSTTEAICEGVPMLSSPMFGDQRVNARHVSDVWRVGIHLEGLLGRDEIANGIGRLMGDSSSSKEREEMMKRVMDLKMKVDGCLKPGGSSYKSLQKLTCYLFSSCQPEKL